jgi:CheY-like chemotaxis protein
MVNPTENNNLKIVIIEDDPIAKKTIEVILSKTNSNFVSFEEAEDAIDYLSKGNPCDIVLLDYHLPKMNGKTFCQIVRNPPISKTYPHLWIIAHTAEIRLDLISEVLEAGTNDYLPKPIDPNLFLLKFLVTKKLLLERKAKV